MSWLLLLFYIELGSVVDNEWVMYEAASDLHQSPQYYTELGARAEMFDHLFIEGMVKTRMYSRNDNYTYRPFTDEYTIGMGLMFGNIEVGFRHFCTHPVIPYIETVSPGIRYEGGYEELYIIFDTRRNDG